MRAFPLLGTLVLMVPVCAQGADPTTVLEVYQSVLARGDVQGALAHCAMPVGTDPMAAAQAMESVEAMRRETDVVGVVRALSLFAPQLTGPVVRTTVSDEGGDAERVIEYDVSAPLAFRQRVHFVQVDGTWRIDLAKSLADNAAGTKVESLIASLTQRSRCAERLTTLSQALSRYMDAHNGRLPDAAQWREGVRTQLDDAAVLDCVVGGTTSIAMNSRLSGLAGAEISAPEKTVLLFDSHDGVALGGDESLMDRRHGGVANVLLASGAVVSVETTYGLKWAPGAEASPDVARSVTRPIRMVGGVEYVILRDCLEPLGAEIRWDATSNTTSIACLGRQLQLTEGRAQAVLDGMALTASAPPVSDQGKLLVPVSLLSRAFGLLARFGDGQVSLMPDGM